MRQIFDCIDNSSTDQGWMDAALREWREHRCAEALGELLKAHRDRAFGIALRLTGSPADAEDVVQEAFIKLLGRTNGFDDLDAFQVSVYRAITQCGLDVLRKRKRRRSLEVRTQETGEPHVPDSQPVNAEQQETQTLLRNAVTELPDDERVPVVLCYYQGLSVVQTARTLELPRETVRARLGRAVEKLRRTLKGHGRDLGAAVIAGLLWQDGAGSAPASLCSALDQALPGRSCSQVAPLPKPALDPSALPHVWGATHTLVGMAVAILLIGVSFYALSWHGPLAQEYRNPSQDSERSATVAESGAKMADAPRNQPGTVEKQVIKEEQPVKAKVAAAVLTGLVLAGGVKADDGDVKSVIARIEARRAEKAAAEAKAATRAAKAEAGESSDSEGREQEWIQIPGGQTIMLGGDKD